MPSTADFLVSIGTYAQSFTTPTIYFGAAPVSIHVYDNSTLGLTGGYGVDSLIVTPCPTGGASWTETGFAPSGRGDEIAAFTITGPGVYTITYNMPFTDGGVTSITKTNYIMVSNGATKSLNTNFVTNPNINIVENRVVGINGDKFNIIK